MKKSSIEILCDAAVQNRVFPGCSFVLGGDGYFWAGASGNLSWADGSQSVTSDTMYDLASLTKVLDTTVRAHRVITSGKVSLGTAVHDLVPRFEGEGKASITLEDLLRHRSGLPAHVEYWKLHLPRAGAKLNLFHEPLTYEPRTQSVYSCVGFMILMEALKKCGAVPEIEKYVHPWGIPFRVGVVPEAAPTEGIRGVVHDENCRFFGGFAGNAGLFGTAIQVGGFAQLILEQLGEWKDWITPDKGLSTRALGWDTKSLVGSSAGSLFGSKSFGHTGFTGTSLWIDPERRIFAGLLSNRIHPLRNNERIKEFRPLFADAACEFLAANGY